MDDLTVKFSHLDRSSLLEDWRWLIGETKQPILIAAIGNAFLEDEIDGSIHILDVGPGELRPIASSVDEFRELLTQRNFVMDELCAEIIDKLIQMGRKLAPGQVYGFVKPPSLGGAYAPENHEPTDIEVHFSLLGQVHRQTHALPPGSPIRQVSIE